MQKRYLLLKNFVVKNLVFLIAFFSFLPFFILIPPFEANDEKEHIKMVVSLSHGFYSIIPQSNFPNLMIPALDKIEKQYSFGGAVFEIPRFVSSSNLLEEKGDYASGYQVSYESYYPPIYYLFSLIFYYLSKVSDQLVIQYYILRVSTALFYFAYVLIAYKVLLLLTRPNIAKNILLFVAINPYVIKMGVGINPDMSFSFISLVFLYYLLKKKGIILLSSISALTFLTKLSGIFTNMTFVLVLAFQEFKKASIKKLLIFEIVFAIISAPWYLSIFLRYNTFLPETYTSICSKASYSGIFEIIYQIFIPLIRSVMHFSGFLMGFGWSYPFPWFYTSFTFLFIILSFIGIYALYKSKNKYHRPLLFYSLSLIVFLLALSTKQRIIDSYDCDLHGRYILPIYPILCFYVYKGLGLIFRNETLASKVLIYFSIFHYYYALVLLVIARYYV